MQDRAHGSTRRIASHWLCWPSRLESAKKGDGRGKQDPTLEGRWFSLGSMRALNLGGTWSPHTTERYYGREIGRPGKARGRRLWLSPRPQSMRDNVQIFEGSCFLSTWSFVLQVKCTHCLQSHRKIVCAHPTFVSHYFLFLFHPSHLLALFFLPMVTLGMMPNQKLNEKRL